MKIKKRERKRKTERERYPGIISPKFPKIIKGRVLVFGAKSTWCTLGESFPAAPRFARQKNTEN